MHALGECPGLRLGYRVAGHQLGIVQFQHRRARSRRRHDVVEAIHGLDRRQRKGLGRRSVAAIVGGLSAAGLARRNPNLASRSFQQAHGSKADAGAHEIDEARDEQRHARPPRITIGHDEPARSGSLLNRNRLCGDLYFWVLR